MIFLRVAVVQILVRCVHWVQHLPGYVPIHNVTSIIIMPPMISQYLNVVKNSTLAGFIGFPDLFSVISTSQNQTGRAVECVTILMLFYLTVSLSISLVMNWFNKRVALVER